MADKRYPVAYSQFFLDFNDSETFHQQGPGLVKLIVAGKRGQFLLLLLRQEQETYVSEGNDTVSEKQV